MPYVPKWRQQEEIKSENKWLSGDLAPHIPNLGTR
jgi:hypothetical protein